MTYICGKWLKYLRNDENVWETDVDLGEIAKICGKWLKYLIKGLIN